MDNEKKRKAGRNPEVETDDSFSPCQTPSGICGNNCGKTDMEFDLGAFDPGDWSDDEFPDINSIIAKRTPTIYYGSRTHRQISQVVKEFGRTSYTDKRMTILSSRDFSCIQDTDRDKTTLCTELLDPAKKIGCPYYSESNKTVLSTHRALDSLDVPQPWDIEDLVKVGKELHVCPYFAARNLMMGADIVFCPYNYIIDPSIRETMQIDITGSIIILDEAHNIEDICRNVGSVSLPTTDLEGIMKECDGILQAAAAHKKILDVHYISTIAHYIEKILKFINTTELKPQGNSDTYSSTKWTGPELVNVFALNAVLTPSSTIDFTNACERAVIINSQTREAERMGKTSPLVPSLTNDVIRKLEKIVFALKMAGSQEFANDYRAIVKQVPLGYKKEKSLEFMCMNPAVIFAPLCEIARTVVLASGTLSPMNSYQGELGVKFPFIIQANHVTPQEQVCIKCVSKGPAGISLKATYQNINSWGFQDDLGEIVLTACESVPHGILMFFSSYSSMGTLLSRWKNNGTWQKLERVKVIFQETRGSSDLANMMNSYREAIVATSNGPIGNITGALLFAVFRGKVAEGIDFSDNEARAVLTVGIPYAVRNDPEVDMKYQYNDINRKRGLLSGNDWYTTQAFRALNQALGRAIRHQNDWGAIILIDERFLEVRHMNLLPAWVQSMWIRQTGMEPNLRQVLKCFVARQIKRERQKLREMAIKN